MDEPEGAAKVKSWPVPLRATLCGLPEALSEILIVPVRLPPAVGLKVTEIEQLAPALTVVPQVLVWEKSPLAVMPEMVSEALPVLVSVTVCAALLVPDIWAEKVSEEEDKLTASPVPVPLKFTVCVLPSIPLLLSVMVSVPVSGPLAVGEKVTLIVREPLAATLPPQLSVSPKLALGAMPVMVSAALPVLLRVTGCDPLVVPTLWLPNVRLPGWTPAAGAVELAPDTRKGTLLVSVPLGVTTWTFPVVAPTGMVVVISELETTVKVAAVPLKLTLVAPVRFVPRMMTVAPTAPEVGSVWTNGPRPTDRLKTVPQPPVQTLLAPPSPVVPYMFPSLAWTNA